MTIGERIDRESPQQCLICGQTVSVVRDWPVCPACNFDQTCPEAYAIRKARGLLWRSGITEACAADSFPDNQPSNVGRDAGQPLFSAGQIVATPGALRTLERANQSPAEFLQRHVAGDWGELDSHDIAENEYSLTHGFRLLSSYRTTAGEALWVITEADRSVTTLLLPEEY
ncbi:MAG TPA: hypothetical protein VGX94_05795 [Terriglobia bacterium]|nr:hypothetical protein [Terriglobia bacterium]